MEAAASQRDAGERLIATRDLRVAVGEEREIVEVKAGSRWPPNAPGNINQLVRTGHLIRFDEAGNLDRRSWRFARRLGIVREPPAQVRKFLEAARERDPFASVNGIRLRVFAGAPDRHNADLVVADGRAFRLYRGRPDHTMVPPLVARPSPSCGGSKKRRRRRTAGT